MKKFRGINKFKSISILVLVLTLFLSNMAFGAPTTVSYKIVSTSDKGGIVFESEEVAADTNETYFDVLERICSDNDIPLDASGSGSGIYVRGINGEYEKRYLPNEDYYSGWMFRVNNVLHGYSAGDPANSKVAEGDKITWYYACPSYTYFPILDDSDVNFDSSGNMTVDVDAEIFEDVWNWQIITVPLDEGRVVLEGESGNKIYATINDGEAVFDETDLEDFEEENVKVYVEGKWYGTTENPDHCPKIVKSEIVRVQL
ncbi:DUF4430 domain-containing protein [Sporanaerobacter sp. PP17-6a]|uniref:DUF4430 domain-containing protein n=1 Tax=Sporanaerobacter sp. PP17-6a TaxID=1891289 RepID=UPI0008A08823|nr:DUF4430 domain-containing protein [Sporanaerobacter sp. PP17-6a]SCL85900.1 hypothetical protein PP176A_0961 [Sporanaerobacter sp. PP17-6a]